MACAISKYLLKNDLIFIYVLGWFANNALEVFFNIHVTETFSKSKFVPTITFYKQNYSSDLNLLNFFLPIVFFQPFPPIFLITEM
jgi:hypothetical protein